jgi:hypothetical protein
VTPGAALGEIPLTIEEAVASELLAGQLHLGDVAENDVGAEGVLGGNMELLVGVLICKGVIANLETGDEKSAASLRKSLLI